MSHLGKVRTCDEDQDCSQRQAFVTLKWPSWTKSTATTLKTRTSTPSASISSTFTTPSLKNAWRSPPLREETHQDLPTRFWSKNALQKVAAFWRMIIIGKERRQELIDVTMGNYDGAEIFELVGLHTFRTLPLKLDMKNIALYHDDGLATHQESRRTETERHHEDILRLRPKNHHQLQNESSNFFHITLNLNNSKHYPHRKPNDRPVYIRKDSNHPLSIIKSLSEFIIVYRIFVWRRSIQLRSYTTTH